jgi:hypothetical protein
MIFLLFNFCINISSLHKLHLWKIWTQKGMTQVLNTDGQWIKNSTTLETEAKYTSTCIMNPINSNDELRWFGKRVIPAKQSWIDLFYTSISMWFVLHWDFIFMNYPNVRILIFYTKVIRKTSNSSTND